MFSEKIRVMILLHIEQYSKIIFLQHCCNKFEHEWSLNYKAQISYLSKNEINNFFCKIHKHVNTNKI